MGIKLAVFTTAAVWVTSADLGVASVEAHVTFDARRANRDEALEEEYSVDEDVGDDGLGTADGMALATK